ncbi:MAG: amino acid-binding protein [Deltaproteobacteria bacterium]|nr:MAG: amino acid-binding protein [Deltaproteobacteria bacterium]
MTIRQISIELENKPGELSKISDLLGRGRVNIKAISASSTDEISTVHFVADDPEKASNIFKTHGYKVKETEVFAVETPDHPGGLNAVLKPLREASINVIYLYPYIGLSGSNAILILGVDKTTEAIEVLKANWVRILEE